ncbi:anthranilate phosphoribosyltransferase [Motiliproteus sp.]|uniref:anthranilate phosphoribosyltransferase n=1 Tax=Motiliproteus sp. TaxID=1898955 RepID=UPI003BA884FC
MEIQAAIKALTEGESLTSEQMRSVMRTVMTGEATQAQIGGFLIALRMKGETVDEVAGAAQVMRELASGVQVSGDHVVDTCGTGGDGAGIFNVSTAGSFVVAAAGGLVAKHGNRSISSSSGSADLLEAAGVNLGLSPEQVGQCIEQLGVGFMFAPAHHSAMKHAIGPRREMGVRTVFNVLGPLTNPAGAPNQVLGVFSSDWVRPLAEVLQRLGSRHVMVVHAEDGLDEISIAGPTLVAELKDGQISEYTLTPEQLGLNSQPLDPLVVENAEQSLVLVRDVLSGKAGAAADIIKLNAGAAIYVAGLAESLQTGVDKAAAILQDGSAEAKLAALVELSNQLAE